jgi:hypothetical protein
MNARYDARPKQELVTSRRATQRPRGAGPWAVALALALAVTVTCPRIAAAGGGVTNATITDPVLGMTAYSVAIPAGWQFQGTVFPGPACDELPYPVYRAYSADGLSEMRVLPRFDWTFNTLQPGRRASSQCLPLDRTLNATEFLHYYTQVIGATYVGTMSVAPLVQQRTAAALAQINQIGAASGSHAEGDVAAIRVRSRNGSFVIEQRLRAWVVCKSMPFFQGSTLHGCFARVDVLRAPLGKLDALAQLVDDRDLNTAPANMAWQLRERDLLQARGNARLAAQAAHNNAVMQAQQERFEQSMAIQQHSHDEFMAQMQASTDSSMRNANASMAARSTSTSDWVDYALDQQTVTGPGGTAKVSSSYSHTWSNGQGQWYQSNDPNSNPNGVFGGNWTEDTRVHGNGSP